MGAQHTILVLFGITGDLARRKLLPGLRSIARAGLLPPLHIIGVSRQAVTAQDIVRQTFGETYDAAARQLEALLTVHTMDLAHGPDYQRLAALLAAQQQALNVPTQVLLYLSVPPQATVSIAERLGQAGINGPDVKVLLEKPFGVDLSSAQESVDALARYFDEQQLYRIDHYLAKEMAQNILAFRSRNALFSGVWNARHIERIDIVASERIGIEGRVAFYEQAGALRDVVQNHLLQLLALTIMELPHTPTAADIPQRRLQALKSLRLGMPDQFARTVRRGQYAGYAAEASNPGSTTETFAALTFYSDHPQWQGVPLTVATGKALDRQTTEIRVYFTKAHAAEANVLTLHIQPREGISMELSAKKPGYDKQYAPVDLHFTYDRQLDKPVDAYERVLLDAMQSDKSLFTTADEVLTAWRLLQPVQSYWAMHTDDLSVYQPGTTIEDLLGSP